MIKESCDLGGKKIVQWLKSQTQNLFMKLAHSKWQTKRNILV